MPLSVGVTLEKVAKGEFHHLTREEIFGLTNQRFLKQHKISPEFTDLTMNYLALAAQYRNSKHPHVRKLKLDVPMDGYDKKLKELYRTTVDRIVAHFRKTVHDGSKPSTMALAQDDDDDQGYQVSDISKESFLAGVRSILQKSKADFSEMNSSYNSQAYQLGRQAARDKLSKYVDDDDLPEETDEEDQNDIVSSYNDSDQTYYGDMLDDVEDDARDSFNTPAPDRDSFLDTLTGALFGQFYRTDLFVGDLYRVAQDAQLSAFNSFQDPAGKEWKYKWKAVVDDSTCATCLELDGDPEAYYLNEFEYDPGDVHFYCRCDLEPVPPEDDEEPEATDDPDNPDGDPSDSVDPEDSAEAPENFDDLMYEPERGDNWQAMLAGVNPQVVDSYLENTTLEDKLDDFKTGNLAGKRWHGVNEVVNEHFSARHGVGVSGEYDSLRWWKSLDNKQLKKEIDMLLRSDKILDALKADGQSTFAKSISGDVRTLQIIRAPGRMDNTAFYREMNHGVYIHDKTFTDLGNDAFMKNQVLTHEFAHALDSSIRNVGGENLVNLSKMKKEWFSLVKENEEHITGFASPYGYTSWKKLGNVDEDIAEAVSYYVLRPNFMQADPIRAQKYELLKKYIFKDTTFSGIDIKNIF